MARGGGKAKEMALHSSAKYARLLCFGWIERGLLNREVFVQRNVTFTKTSEIVYGRREVVVVIVIRISCN